MVTQNRKLRKDVFYFYKANWTQEPMVYIASRRMTPRKQAVAEVKVYSNLGEVELRVNGKSLGVRKPDSIRVCRWESIQLQPGKNEIQAAGKAVTDQCEWVLEQ
jgi:beta-galactosidase